MDILISKQAAIDTLCDNCDHVEAVCPHYPCKHYMTTGAFGTPLRKEDYWCDAENFPDEGQKELPEWWFCAGAERKDAT